MATDRLSVLTLNIWNYEGPWAERLPLIRECLDELKPDLVAMQEVLVGDKLDQRAAIFDGTPYRVEYARAQAFWLDSELGFGNLVASRWPLLDTETIELPQRDSVAPRVALITAIDSPHGRLLLASTHLTYPPDDGVYRERQARALAEGVRARHDADAFPAIVCGDFNAEPDAAEIRFMRGLQSVEGASTFFVDAHEIGGTGSGATVTAASPYVQDLQKDLRLDYIFVERATRGRGRVLDCRVVADQAREGVYPSDHFGVYAELSVG